jgi:hypothetical protein
LSGPPAALFRGEGGPISAGGSKRRSWVVIVVYMEKIAAAWSAPCRPAASDRRRRRPSRRRVSSRRLKGTCGTTPLWRPDSGRRMPPYPPSLAERAMAGQRRHETIPLVRARDYEPAQLEPWRGGDVGTPTRWLRRRRPIGDLVGYSRRTIRRDCEPEGDASGGGLEQKAAIRTAL